MSDEGTDRSRDPGGAQTALDAFVEYVASRGEEDAPDFESWVRRYPQFEAELRQLESDWRGFDELFRNALASLPSEGSIFHRRRISSPERVVFVQFEPDKLVGDFRLVERIGQGGMGEVWKAEQRSLQRHVALKFIRPDRISDQSEALFDREARAGGRLNHPGVVSVYATGQDGDLHWIAQELVADPCSLAQFLTTIKEEGDLPAGYLRRVATFVYELCDALQVAHEANVVHRDLKPSNILITPDDHPKVTDFGLARLMDEEALSGSYGVLGTPVYMSPEQAAGESKLIDHRTDVYSLGSVLFEMITLRRPFEGETAQVLKKIQSEDPPDPRSVRAEVPADLAGIVLKALEKRPSDRYATMREFGEDLRRFLNDEPVRARPPGPLLRARKWMRRHPTATSLAAVLVVAGGAVGFLGRRASEASRRSDLHEQQALLTSAWRRIDVGDLEGAAAEIVEFNERFPRDPEGHLVLAAGYARSFRVTEMERELAALERKGEEWDEVAFDDGSALGLCLEALRWLAVEKGSAYPRIRVNLERALELDPELEVALFPLYQVCKAQGDVPAARDALAAYRGTLRTSDPNVQLVDAMIAELEGDLERARSVLAELRASEGDEAFGHLRGFRALGRVLVESYLAGQGAEPELLERGVTFLERAVADVPRDYSSLALLSKGHLLQADRTSEPAAKRSRLEAAERRARESLAIADEASGARKQLAGVELKRLLLDFDAADPPAPSDFARVRAALAEVERREPGHRFALAVEAELRFREGEVALARGRESEAAERYAASVELNPDHLQARVMLGEVQFMRGEHEAALASFRAAEDLWERREASGGLFTGAAARFGRSWLFTILVWGLGAADHAGRLELARDFERKARAELDTIDAIAMEVGEEILTLAEFLALPANGELRDCELALRLIGEHRLRARFGDVYGDLLDRIEQACR